MLGAAVLRAVVALIQGNTGDGQKASFTKPSTVSSLSYYGYYAYGLGVRQVHHPMFQYQVGAEWV